MSGWMVVNWELNRLFLMTEILLSWLTTQKDSGFSAVFFKHRAGRLEFNAVFFMKRGTSDDKKNIRWILTVETLPTGEDGVPDPPVFPRYIHVYDDRLILVWEIENTAELTLRYHTYIYSAAMLPNTFARGAQGPANLRYSWWISSLHPEGYPPEKRLRQRSIAHQTSHRPGVGVFIGDTDAEYSAMQWSVDNMTGEHLAEYN